VTAAAGTRPTKRINAEPSQSHYWRRSHFNAPTIKRRSSPAVTSRGWSVGVRRLLAQRGSRDGRRATAICRRGRRFAYRRCATDRRRLDSVRARTSAVRRLTAARCSRLPSRHLPPSSLLCHHHRVTSHQFLHPLSGTRCSLGHVHLKLMPLLETD